VRGNLRSLVSANEASTLHVALHNGEVIGFALTNSERFGPFGVNEAYRGQGVGAVLLSRALCAMRARNIHTAYFLWTSDQTARLYARHGFEIVRRFTMVSKKMENEQR
jgi:N-acetylglutamate synthase-like GNAT family acetyltransferase